MLRLIPNSNNEMVGINTNHGKTGENKPPEKKLQSKTATNAQLAMYMFADTVYDNFFRVNKRRFIINNAKFIDIAMMPGIYPINQLIKT